MLRLLVSSYFYNDNDNNDNNNYRILGLKINSFIKIVKVLLGFPFVIVVSSLNLSSKINIILRSIYTIRLMNILMYGLPLILVFLVLKEYNDTIQVITIGLYIGLYILPIAFVVLSKMATTVSIQDGTFCFKPAGSVKFTFANFFAMVGMLFEWIQHILYVLPLDVINVKNEESPRLRLSDFPPYLPFQVYFWIAVTFALACGVILILNEVLRGKLHYRFKNNPFVWFFLYNVGSPMYMAIITILFMGLCCDSKTTPSVLVQDSSIVCYASTNHIIIAVFALFTIALYIIQHTLLPSGTFKESMRKETLDIVFVPVHLQMHFLLKTIFCYLYVFFYEDSVTKIIGLTIINFFLLCLNNAMKPSSVEWVNSLKELIFIHASLSGIQSINYLGVQQLDGITVTSRALVITTLASNLVFTGVTYAIFNYCTYKSKEYTVAKAFLDLDWQMNSGLTVHPRVLEPLISLTLSKDEHDWNVAKTYVKDMVGMISHEKIRVQFQAAWVLANLALIDEEARVLIANENGLQILFSNYETLDPVVQLEVLAAIVNLTLSDEVSKDIVTKFKGLHFFLKLATSSSSKHSHFATIAIGNLVRIEENREKFLKLGGIHALVGNIMSNDYHKRKYGCLALANLALSLAKDIEEPFESKALIRKILKIAIRNEAETQREVIALIRNLSCHSRLRPILLERGVMKAIDIAKKSVFQDVIEWSNEITDLMEKEISSSSALIQRERSKGKTVGETDIELLLNFKPLLGKVEWSTWGSKLETIFTPLFSDPPILRGLKYTTDIDTGVAIDLSQGLLSSEINKVGGGNVVFKIVTYPVHGKLKPTDKTSKYMYTPNDDYIGNDKFTFYAKLGLAEIRTKTTSCSIVIKKTKSRNIENIV